MKFVFEILTFYKIEKSLAAHQKSSVAHKRAAARRLRTTDPSNSKNKFLVKMTLINWYPEIFVDRFPALICFIVESIPGGIPKE